MGKEFDHTHMNRQHNHHHPSRCSRTTLLVTEHGASVSIIEQKTLGDVLLQSQIQIEPGERVPVTLIKALHGNGEIVDIEAIVPPRQNRGYTSFEGLLGVLFLRLSSFSQGYPYIY